MQTRKDADQLKDLRSQGRKRLRAALLQRVEDGELAFECAKCGWSPTPPLTRSNNLDANHISKDLTDCDPANGEWLCRSCHKKADLETPKGVSKVGDEYGYSIEDYL